MANIPKVKLFGSATVTGLALILLILIACIAATQVIIFFKGGEKGTQAIEVLNLLIEGSKWLGGTLGVRAVAEKLSDGRRKKGEEEEEE